MEDPDLDPGVATRNNLRIRIGIRNTDIQFRFKNNYAIFVPVLFSYLIIFFLIMKITTFLWLC